MDLDRSSPVPLYFQVAQALQAAITCGEIPPGSQFSNEIELADRLSLSRPTMRQAMQYLVEQGLIVRRRGIGTRVVQPKVHRPLELTSLYDDLERSGRTPTTRLVRMEVVEADSNTAILLGVAPGDAVTNLERVRSAGGVPIARMTNAIPVSIIELDPAALEGGGLYQRFRSSGITLHSATQAIGARSATVGEARLLEQPKGTALLTVQRTTHDDRGRIVEYGDHVYVASLYSIEVHLRTA
ncbi:MAG: GntR family transcriptional regulator [Actinomycetota bacterium]|nr:GntR family transcriptional regulator [Actinomycetota bacterium]